MVFLLALSTKSGFFRKWGVLCSLEQRAQFVPPPFNGESFLELWERGGFKVGGKYIFVQKYSKCIKFIFLLEDEESFY